MLLASSSAGLTLNFLLSKFREDRELVGVINGVNAVYSLPDGDKAFYAEPGVKIKVLYNGQRMHEGALNDFITSESGGPGSGYDTITFIDIKPVLGDVITADYIKSN